MEKILKRIQNMQDQLDRIEEHSESMVGHILFIEGVYRAMRTPLDFILTNIRKFMGLKNEDALPPCLPLNHNSTKRNNIETLDRKEEH